MIKVIPNWHPFFVHFTVALITVSALCFLVGYLLNSRKTGKELLIVARWCLWLGTLAAIATLSAGFIAYYTVAHDTPSHLAMTEHRNWAIATFVFIFLVAAWSVYLYFKKKAEGLYFVLAMFVVVILLMSTAWRGAEVVYRYGVGVMSLPKSTGDGHQHQHGNDVKTEPGSPQRKKEQNHSGHKH